MKKFLKKHKLLLLLIFFSCALLISNAALAANAPVSLTDVSPVGNLTGAAGVATLIGRIIRAFLGIIGAVALLMFVYGGFLMLTSAGKSDAINKGKTVLVWAVIGIAVILGSYILTNFILTGITRGIVPQAPSSTGGTTPATTFTPPDLCAKTFGAEWSCVANPDSAKYYIQNQTYISCPNATDKCARLKPETNETLLDTNCSTVCNNFCANHPNCTATCVSNVSVCNNPVNLSETWDNIKECIDKPEGVPICCCSSSI
ncbi:MAG: pilin [Patescibacteria group bacterium]